MKTTLKLFPVLLVLLFLVNKNEQVGAQTAVDLRFGAVESFFAPNEARELGVGWERILFYWNSIQPFGPGDWNTLHVQDEWLTEAAAQGRTVVGLLKNTPQWATDGENAAGVPRGLYLPVDDPGNLWANFVRQTATYYGPRGVHNWIVWNEPDIAPNVYGHEFSGSVEDYYQLVKVAYQVIKQVDPGATIHLGGMTYWHDPAYLRKYFRVVAADPEAAANNFFFDVISLHIYFRPETMLTIIGNAYAIQQEFGIAPLKSVWVNETNARPSMDPEWPVQVESFPLDLDQQAWFIPQAFSLGFSAGAGRMAVYKLVDIQLNPGDESWGLVRPYDFSRRPAFFAYQMTIQQLSGFTYPVQRQMTSLYTIVTFNRPQGVTRVLWARTPQAVSLQVPALAGGGRLISAVGEVSEVTAVNGVYEIGLEGARCYGECLLGGPPLFLVEDGVTAQQAPTVPPPPPPTNTPAPTLPPSPIPLPTETPMQTATAVPTEMPTSSPTATPTKTATPAPSATVTETPEPTETAVPTLIAQLLPTHEPTETAVPETPIAESDDAPIWMWWVLLGGLGLGVFTAVFAWLRRN